MGSSKTLLKEIARELDGILARTGVAGTPVEIGKDADATDLGPDLDVWSTIDDLRSIALKMSVVLERLIDVTNLDTVEDRVGRWPRPGIISLPETPLTSASNVREQ